MILSTFSTCVVNVGEFVCLFVFIWSNTNHKMSPLMAALKFGVFNLLFLRQVRSQGQNDAEVGLTNTFDMNYIIKIII